MKITAKKAKCKTCNEVFVPRSDHELCERCYQRKYYLENREEIRERKKRYRKNHLEEMQKREREYDASRSKKRKAEY